MEADHGCMSMFFYLLLFFSLFLNLFFLFPSAFQQLILRPGELTWTKEASTVAETVAAITCSGHGLAFVDGVPGTESLPVCECNTCYGGDDCSVFDLDCFADVESGDPMFLEPYWKKHASISAVVISGWHRMSYRTDNSITLIELENHIRLLHSHVGNAIIDDKFIVFGVGSMQLINALVYALSSETSTPATVVAAVPYYNSYKSQTLMFDSKSYDWKGDAWNLSDTIPTNLVIEFVTCPNNPDGQLNKPVLNGSSVIYDHAYYWPHYTAIQAPADGDAMLFTMSKVSGHAGSRFGWALIRSPSVYEKVLEYVNLNSIGTSHESNLRMLTIIKAMLAEKEEEPVDDIFGFGKKIMSERWKRLNDIVSLTKRFSLQSLDPLSCTYFNTQIDPSPAYGWLKCEMEEDDDCHAVLKEGGILSRSGSHYGDSARYTRLSLLKGDDDFQMLLLRLSNIVGVNVLEQEYTGSDKIV